MLEVITIVGVALGLGLVISLVYMFAYRKTQYTQSFTLSLIMLPGIIALIITLIGNNVASAFSMAGAFSLIRFRSTPGDSKDIAYVFFTLGVGLACGMGYISEAAVFTLMLSGVMLLLTHLGFGVSKNTPLRLKMTVPEDLEYHGLLDDILTTYTHNYKLLSVKTTEFGALFEITYAITMKDMANSKEMIDQLRAKNGNLKVLLASGEKNKESL